MEEEYRMQKAQADIQKASTTIVNGNGVAEGDSKRSDAYGDGDGVIYEDGTISYSRRVDDNASTRGILSPATPNGLSTHTIEDTYSTQATPIPTIRVSTESNRVARGKEQRQDEGTEEATLIEDAGNEENVRVKENEPVEENRAEKEEMGVQGLERPVQAAAGEEKGGSAASDASLGPTAEAFSFSNKRLCERWLDNLFMVLYEVCVFPPSTVLCTICFIPADMYKYTHRTSACGQFSVLKWLTSRLSMLRIARRVWNGKFLEILGQGYTIVRRRKRHISGVWIHPGVHVFELPPPVWFIPTDLPFRYSHKPWSKLMQMYAEEGDIQRTIQTAIRVAAYHYAEYTEMTVRSPSLPPGQSDIDEFSTLLLSRGVSSNSVNRTDMRRSGLHCRVWGCRRQLSES